jgi:hypothetical protein
VTLREFETFAIIAALIAAWHQVRAWLAWPVSLLIIRRRVDGYSCGSILNYLHDRCRPRLQGDNYYSSERPYVRPLGRAYRVWYEALKGGRTLFWLTQRPIWYSPVTSNKAGVSSPEENGMPSAGAFFYFRWSVDWDALLASASAHEDAAHTDVDATVKNRFSVRFHGMASIAGQAFAKSVSNGAPSPPTSKAPMIAAADPGYGARLLHWQRNDLSERAPLSLDALSLRPELVGAAVRIRRWADSKEWHEECGIPWRIGLLLHGVPGAGKTAFARALAVEHNMTIHVFDLSSLDNYSLTSAWGVMMADAPCMALIEDLHTEFDGDKPLRPDSGVTYGRLLNLICGVQSSDGVLLVVTTNDVSTVAPALRRRGRLDLTVEVLGLDQAGREKMVARVLRDRPDLAAGVLSDPMIADMTPADLQDHLIKLALDAKYGDDDGT